MKSPLPSLLQKVINDNKTDSGANASYIPDLKNANPHHQGVALMTVDGDMYAAGDVDVPFAIESISKAFAYALALQDHGLAKVSKFVGMEPSGDAFNVLSLDPTTGRPDNPLINAGAITTAALVKGKNGEERYRRIHDAMSRCAGRPLPLNQGIDSSELNTADRNHALAFMLHMTGIIECDPMEAVQWYTAQCSVNVTAKDLAAMGATLANGGVQPVTKERVFDEALMQQVLSVMFTCGMYNYAGDWVGEVGIPSKSGVGGGIIGAVPGEMCIATFSPQLDAHGNSYRGIKMFEQMSRELGLHLLRAVPSLRNALRKDQTVMGVQDQPLRIVGIQGAIDFLRAVRVSNILCAMPDGRPDVVLDMRHVTAVNDSASVLLALTLNDLTAAGHRVSLVDPKGLLPAEKAKDVKVVPGYIDLVHPDYRADKNQARRVSGG
jgi:glutaminase